MTDLADLLQSRPVRLGLRIAGVLVVLAILAAGGWFWLRTQDSQGLRALAEAAELLQQADAPAATPEARRKAIGALEDILARHGRSSAAPQAAYQLGNLRYAAGDYAAARGAYEVALAKGAAGAIRTLSALGIGYTFEAQKNYAAAVTAYETVIRSLAPKSFLYEDAFLDLARAQGLAGKPADALATYQRLLKEAPDTRRAADIRARIAELQSRSGK